MKVTAAITNEGHFVARQPVHLRPNAYAKVNELVQKKGMHITLIISHPIVA